jgi:GT2 family glycosyltransferase
MPYLLADLELTQPLPTLCLSSEETGIALILRRKNRPMGFLMAAKPPDSILTPEELAPLISAEVGTRLLQESLREELLPTVEPRPFPSLSVAICTKDRPDSLARCLESLQNLQIAAGDPRFEILVIDNAPSDDRTQTLVTALPHVRYVREPMPGLDFARNRAIAAATGVLLAFIDDDVVVDRQWFDGLMEAWQENPDAGAFTGQVLPFELATAAQVLFERRGGFRHGFEKVRYGQTAPDDTLRIYPCSTGRFGVGCNMAFRRDVLQKIGGFDEALDTGRPLPGGGDHDIFYRVIRAGFPLVYEPHYLVFHQHRREYEKLRHQYWTWGLSLMAFIAKSYQSDPEESAKWRRLLGWWFQHQLRQFLRSLLGRHALTPDLVLAELSGGVVGLLGEYSRSLKRTEAIRRQYS